MDSAEKGIRRGEGERDSSAEFEFLDQVLSGVIGTEGGISAEVLDVVTPLGEGAGSAPAVDMLLHFGFELGGEGIDAIDRVGGLIGGVEEVGEAIDEIVFEDWIFEEPPEEVGSGFVVMIVQGTVGRGVGFEHIERPGGLFGPETAPADVVVELEPAPSAFRPAGTPEAMVANVPAVTKDFGDFVIDIIGEIDAGIDFVVGAGLLEVGRAQKRD